MARRERTVGVADLWAVAWILLASFAISATAQLCPAVVTPLASYATTRLCDGDQECANLSPPTPLTCNGAGSCRFSCTGNRSCAGSTILCNANLPCLIDCVGPSACEGSTLLCPNGAPCLISCRGSTACYAAQMYGSRTSGDAQISCVESSGCTLSTSYHRSTGRFYQVCAPVGYAVSACLNTFVRGTNQSAALTSTATMLELADDFSYSQLNCENSYRCALYAHTDGTSCPFGPTAIQCASSSQCYARNDNAACASVPPPAGYDNICPTGGSSPGVTQCSLGFRNSGCTTVLNNCANICNTVLTPSVTPTRSRTPSRTRSRSRSPSRTPSVSLSRSLSRTRTPSATRTRSRTPSISVTPTRTPTTSPSQAQSVSRSPSSTPTVSVTPSTTRSPESVSTTPTVTPSTTQSPASVSSTPSVTPSTTRSPASASATPSVTPSNTFPPPSTSTTPSTTQSPASTSATPSITPSNTFPPPSASTTPSTTQTPASNSATPSVTPSNTFPPPSASTTPSTTQSPASASATPSITPSNTFPPPSTSVTPSVTRTPSATPSITPSNTFPPPSTSTTPSVTQTPVSNSATPSITPSNTFPPPSASTTPSTTQTPASNSATPSITPSNTFPLPSASTTPSVTQTPVSNSATPSITPSNTFPPPSASTTPSITPSNTFPPPSTSTTPSTTPSPSSSETPSATPTSTASETPSASSSPSGTASPSATPSVTPVISATPSVTPSASETPSITPTVTATPSITPSSSATPSDSASPSGTPSVTSSPSITPSITPSLSVTSSITPSPSVTASITPSPSVTPSNTASPSETPSNTASPSVTPSVTSSASSSASNSVTPSATRSATVTGSPSPSVTRSASATASVTPTRSATPSRTATPSTTATPSRSATPSVSASVPVASATASPSPNAASPSRTPSPASPSRTPTRSASPATPSGTTAPSLSPSLSPGACPPEIPSEAPTLADAGDASFYQLQNDVYGGYDRSSGLAGDYAEQVSLGDCDPEGLSVLVPSDWEPFGQGQPPECPTPRVAVEYAASICADPARCTLGEWMAIAQNLTFSGSVLFFDLGGAWATDPRVPQGFRDAQASGVLAVRALRAAAEIYDYLHRYCVRNVPSGQPTDWGLGPSDTIVERHGETLAPSTLLLEDYDPDLDRNDVTALVLHACYFRSEAPGTPAYPYYRLGCTTRFYYLARGGGYDTGLYLDYDGVYDPSHDGSDPGPGCRAQESLLPPRMPVNVAPLFDYSVGPTEQLGSLVVTRYRTSPSGVGPAEGLYDCRLVTLPYSPDEPVFPDACAADRAEGESPVAASDRDVLPPTTLTEYTNTDQGTPDVPPVYALSLRVDFARPLRADDPDAIEAAVASLPSFFLRNRDCNIDLQLFDENVDCTDANGVPFLVEVFGPSFVEWGQEGLPLWAVEGVGQCVHGANSGAACDAPVECPLGRCNVLTHLCEFGPRHGLRCDPSLEQCPFGLACYLDNGTYPNSQPFFSCAAEGCYGPPPFDVPFPPVFVDPSCDVRCYSEDTIRWAERPATLGDVRAFPFERFYLGLVL